MHAGFGAQQAVGVFAFKADGGAVDTGNFAVVLFQNFHFKAFAFGITQIHAQQHARPVFRFGAAGAGGDVDKAVVGIGGLVEHALEFQLGHLRFQRGHVGFDGGKAFGIALFYRHFQQHAVVGYAAADGVEREHNAFQHFALFADFLRALGVVPQFGVFRQPHHFF